MILHSLNNTKFEDIENSNGIFTKHFHDTYTIGITHGGVFQSISASHTSFSYKNSTRVINPGEVHSGDSSAWKYTNVYPKIELIANIYEQMFGEKKIPLFSKHVIEDLMLYQLLYRFFISVYHKEDKMLLEINTIEAFSYLIKNFATSKRDFTPLFDDKKIVKSSIEYIQDNIYTNILLDDLAENYNLSKYHFLRVFKNGIGLTPHSYILTQRVERAKELILNGKCLSEASLEAGFSDQSHFIRNFKKIYGYSPKELHKKSNFILYM
jgi:AraC-like DNA-binding protein